MNEIIDNLIEIDPAGPRVVDPREQDAFERSAQRTMAHAMATHAAKPGRSLMRAGVIAQLQCHADCRDQAWYVDARDRRMRGLECPPTPETIDNVK